MKKLFLIVLVFFVFVFFGYMNKDEKIVYKYEENNYTYVFVESENNELIGVKMVKYSNNLNEEIEEVFNYLTKNNNCLPVGYKNHLILSTDLERYDYDEDRLNLYISDDFLRVKGTYALKQIYYSYLLLGFEHVFLYIDEEKIDYINDIYIEEGIPFFLANPVYDKHEKIVNVYYRTEKDYIKPVSYFIPNNSDIEDYLNVS